MERDQFILEMQEQTDKMDELIRALKEIVKGAGDTMTKDQFIFEKLEMGCWHEWKKELLRGYDAIGCIHCGKILPLWVGHIIPIQPRHFNNLDFTTWEGCGRLLDYLQTDPRAEHFCEMLRTEQSLCCLHEEHIPLSRLKPVIIRDKLADFLGWEEQ